jgi:PAS domain S-box-containing protein
LLAEELLPPTVTGANDFNNIEGTMNIRTSTSAVHTNDAGQTRLAEIRVAELIVKSGALQQAILNSANFSVIATDEKGIVQLFNAGAELMLGYAASDVIDKITPADISDPDELSARAAALSKDRSVLIKPGFEALVFKAARGIEDIYELTYIRKDNSRFPAIVSVTALRTDQGPIIGYLLIATDNTVRKDAEDKRLWAEESFQLMVESVTDCAIIMLDQEGRVESWNEGAQRIQGYRAKEIIGQHNSRFFSQEDIDIKKPERALQEAAAGGRSEDNGWRVRKDGSTFWANVVMTAIRDSRGALRGYATLERDMSERRRVEAELNQARATAEAANLAKSEFLSSMSHELRTPLNAILGFAQLMESDVPPPTLAQKVSIDQILQAGWYLLALINEVLDLSLIESGRLSLSQEKVSLSDVLSDCRAMMEPLALKRGITMKFPENDATCFVMADRTRVRQILVNLLSNAIKYNRPNGSIIVECATRTQGYVRLSVTDTGLGLTEEKLGQLFQPFNRLGQEDGVEQGTGIGLVVTKRLVEVMKGTIGVDSAVNKGTAFWIDLVATTPPRYDFTQADTDTSSRKLEKNVGPVRTVLYVEDNPANLKLVTMLIARRSDLRLLTADTGNLGVELAQAHLPDVILMDINLPGLSGLKVMSILSKDSLTSHIPIIALSANANPRDIEKGLKAGFLKYLTKPIRVDELMETLDLGLALAAVNQPLAPKAA